MNIIDTLLKQREEKQMLTEFIEEHKITLLHGDSGSGKSVWIAKHLNEQDIVPIFIDFDDNEVAEFESLGISAKLLDGDRFMQSYKKHHNHPAI